VISVVLLAHLERLPFLPRAVCLPVLARLWLPGQADRTPLVLARELLDLIVGHLDDQPATWSVTPPTSASRFEGCPPRSP
jgi:hypothetical protein